MIQKPKKLNVPSHKQLIQAKLCLIGNSQSGKSSFISKYLTNQCPGYYEPTLGVQTHNKYILCKNGSTVHVTFWDFNGKIDFVEIRNQFYRQCNNILLFVDLSNKPGTDDIATWVNEVKQAGGTCPIVVVGNKADIKKISDADKIAKNNACQYFQISAKTGQNLNQMVEQVIAQFK